VRKEIAKGPKRDEEIINIELRTQLDNVYKLNKVSFKSNGITSTDNL
jgi:hypothetical protein